MSGTQKRGNTLILVGLAMLMQSIQFISNISVTPWAPYVALSLSLGVMLVSLRLSGLKASVLIGLACPALCWFEGVYQVSTMLFAMLGNLVLNIGLWEVKDFSLRGRITGFLVLTLARFAILSLGMACMMVFLKGQGWLNSVYTAALAMRAQGFSVPIAAVLAWLWLRMTGKAK